MKYIDQTEERKRVGKFDYVGGDFNEIHRAEERNGLGQFDYVGAPGFSNAVHDITKINPTGGPFTWRNELQAHHTQSRLDRAFGKLTWISRWLRVGPLLLFGNASDNEALLIELLEVKKGTKPLRFYNSWTR